MVLGIVKASLEILGIGIGVKKVVLLMSASDRSVLVLSMSALTPQTYLDLHSCDVAYCEPEESSQGHE